MAVEHAPLYFEGCWSILSTIGMVNVLFGILVVGITGYSPITLVPIIVSIAGAIANGFCYFAFYETHSPTATMIGAIMADLCWMIQEAGLSFYSYVILRRVLRARSRLIFLILFWICMVVIVGLRFGILVCRAQDIKNGNLDLLVHIARLHIGYFVFIAVVEVVSAVFLIRIFAEAKKGSVQLANRIGLFHYLTQSTEIRLASLALIGITRAIMYSFQRTLNASDITGQIDRFAFTLECLFPIIMYIDVLASRIARITTINNSTPSNRPSGHSRGVGDKSVKLYSMSHPRSRMGNGHTSSSQEHIVDMPGEDDMGIKSIVRTASYSGDAKDDYAISKTVEFEFHESAAQ